MRVSLSAGLQGHALNNRDLPGPDAFSCDALIRAHQTSLEFTCLTQSPVSTTHMTSGVSYWIGEFNPEHCHAIEVVSPDNLELFEFHLQQRSFYLPAHLSQARPGVIILSHGLACDPAHLDRLHAMSVTVLQSPAPAKTVLRNLAYSLAEHGHHQVCHGVMLSVCGEGVLLRGDSGIGKSGIALELVSRGHSLVADDAPMLHRPDDSGRIYALSSPLLADLLDVQAAGILDINKLFGSTATTAIMPVDLVIDLVRDCPSVAEHRFQPFAMRTNILGVDIPRVQIPVSHVTNLALLVETITRNHVLYKGGFDAGARLARQLQRLIDTQT